MRNTEEKLVRIHIVVDGYVDLYLTRDELEELEKAGKGHDGEDLSFGIPVEDMEVDNLLIRDYKVLRK